MDEENIMPVEVVAEAKPVEVTAEAQLAEAEKTAEKESQKPAEKPAAEGKKPEKKKSRARGITTKAKKKTAVARAVIKRGSGKVRINKRSLALVEPTYVREFIMEPLEMAEPLPKEVDITVTVRGGGTMAQAAAARGAIAKALLEFRKNDKLKIAMLKYDRLLLVDDSRRTEPKKPLGTKARKKKQKSKR